MPLQATSGAASYDAFGGGVAAVPNYIEDVFSAWLYSGNSSTQTITNGIDLSTKGGMVWTKSRNAAYDNTVYDTARGTGNNKALYTDTTDAEGAFTSFQDLTAYNTNGYSIGSPILLNETGKNYVSWTFRKQPKFFDVVTYSGSSSTQNIAHNLGSVPGCIIVKRTSGAEDWFVYHTSLGNTQYIKLNSTSAASSGFAAWNNTSPTSTQFTVLGGRTEVNAAGSDYVAYLFAHDAGGFGLTGTDNVISCGSFTTDGSGAATVNLGYEPQWVMQKRTDSSTGGNWFIADNMRGMTVDGSLGLFPNLSSAEDTSLQGPVRTNATGFTASRFANATYIYIAIRRGPMKVPTSGTSVFNTNIETTTTNPQTLTTGFPVDLAINTRRNSTTAKFFVDRLRGSRTTSINYLTSTNTNEETNLTSLGIGFDNNTGIVDSGWFNESGAIYWNFRRAPSFFDEVCYTGTSSARTITHNLAAVPELMIVKCRSTARAWPVYAAPLGNTEEPRLNESSASGSSTSWNSTTPTSSVFSVSNASIVNASGDTYVAYLFATCAGVSKVGSYTGTATTKQIDCGFTGGARFVLIKRTDSTGDWYVWDTARGIVSGNDSYLLLNSTAAEVTNTDYIDTYSAGFEISSTAPAAINASGGSFIFFAVA